MGSVQNLSLGIENECFVVNWSRPQHSHLCSLSYQLNVQPEDHVLPYKYYTNDTSFILESFCAKIDVTVIPLSNSGLIASTQSISYDKSCK